MTNNYINSAFISLLLQGVSFFLGMAVNIYLARSLSLFDNGTYQYGLTIVSIVTTFSMLGMTNATLRGVSHNVKQSDKLRLLYTSILIVALSSVLVSLAILALYQFFPESKILYSLNLFFYALIPAALIPVICAAIQGFGRVNVSMFILMPFQQIIIFLCLIVFELNLMEIINVYIVTLIITMITALCYLVYKFGVSIPNLKNATKLLESAPSMLLSQISNSLIAGMGVLVLGLLSSQENVALYSVGSRFSVAFTFITIATSRYIAPKVSQYFSEGDIKSVVVMIRIGIVFPMILSAVGLIIITLYSQKILLLFGDKYLVANDVLIVLCASSFVVSCFGVVPICLLMMGEEKNL